MKISPEAYNRLKSQCEDVLQQFPDAAKAYQAAGLTHGRYRWDVFWMATKADRDAGQMLYQQGLLDAHIDTALRNILGSDYSAI